jgi:predicted amidohydrolase YtcJ
MLPELPLPPSGLVRAMSISADLILCNATVLTLDHECPEAGIVAVKGNRILGVGQNDDLELFKDVGTKVIDCQGNTVVPGFNDAHCHPLAFATGLLCVDCRPTSVGSIADIQSQIREQAGRVAEGTWIKAVGYNEFYLAEKRHPTRWDLDEAAPRHPVRLAHRTGHACVLNSLAMRLAGISSETPEPPGGLIERDLETGEPNGILVGMNEQVEKAMPMVSEEEKERGMILANQEFLSQGITSIQDASWNDSLDRWKTFRGLQGQGILKTRVSMMVGAEALPQLRGGSFESVDDECRLRLGAIKMLIDEVSGALNPPQDDINRLVQGVHEASLQVAIHCVEETTVEAAIIALEEALGQTPELDHRHRLEHCSVCPPDLVQRLKSLGAMVVTQPLFLYYGAERYLETVPPEQLKYLYPVGSWAESGVAVATGSDAPVVPLNSLAGIYTAVTRRAQTGQLLGPDQGVLVEKALEIHTLAGAYASFEEGVKGSISPGKLADIAVLSNDPTRVPLESLKDIEVLMTVIDGQVVWER